METIETEKAHDGFLSSKWKYNTSAITVDFFKSKMQECFLNRIGVLCVRQVFFGMGDCRGILYINNTLYINGQSRTLNGQPGLLLLILFGRSCICYYY